MSDTRFAILLEQVMGLSAASIGASAIERAVERRQRDSGARDPDAYWDMLQRSPDELQQLIEAVIVPETWFFRNPQAFRAMERHVVTPLLRANPQGVARLLSLPCSTGEEAYTMAMALLDSGVPGHGFRIDAVDISLNALEQARAGVYGRNSFRGQDLAFRERHFDAVSQGWNLRQAVRAPVHFSQGNIFEPGFMAGGQGYDAIFCRNLLIYFDPPRQKQAISVLKRLLAPDGVLFVGHSEAGLMPGEGLVSAGIAMSFAFRRAPAAARARALPAEAPVRAKAPAVAKVAAAHRAPPFRSRPAGLVAREKPAVAALDLDTLRRAADNGRLEEAAQGCEAYIRENGASAEALLLLGLISDASGQAPAAAGYYRKALYLAPANAEALGHLALLLRRQGDHAGAKLLDERMRRRDERSS